MPLLLLFLFLLLPIAEIYVIVKVGQAIGILPTLAILLLDGFVGAALARSQGRTAWARFNLALAEGRVPARETFDGAMIIVGGALLLAPGFITDVVGFSLLFPPTRALLRGVLSRLAGRWAGVRWTVLG
ncbi:MAG: FxsA family protein, partial [Solirubrobacterales bacterium]